MDNMIATPYTVFVDESGSPVYRPSGRPGQLDGYAVAAVAVNELSVPDVDSVLPRDSSGRILKFSDRDLTPRSLACFVERVPCFDIEVCLVMLETTSSNNIKLSRDLVRVLNERRAGRNNPKIKEASLVYMFAAKDAIVGMLTRLRLRRRRGAWGRFIDIVLDHANTSDHGRGNFATAAPQDLTRFGFHCWDITWTKERFKPMLFVSDLLAGIYRRQATRGDVGKAFDLMESAYRGGRIVILDGMTTPDPEKLKKDENTR